MEGVDVQEMKKQIQERVDADSFQDLVEDMAEKCYSMCIKKPGTALDSYQQRCLGNCMDRYMDSFNTVSRALTAKLSKE